MLSCGYQIPTVAVESLCCAAVTPARSNGAVNAEVVRMKTDVVKCTGNVLANTCYCTPQLQAGRQDSASHLKQAGEKNDFIPNSN